MIKRQIDPWKYTPIGMDSSTIALYKKQYAEIKERDFYNIDPTVIPQFVDPSKLYLYRYLRYEPYFYEMFELNADVHPFHPLHPSTEEIQKIIGNFFFTTRNRVSLPLKKSEARRPERRAGRRCLPKPGAADRAALLMAGFSESETHLSPDGLASDWSLSDRKTDSDATRLSSVSKRRPQPRDAGEVRDPLRGCKSVRELWSSIQAKHRGKDSPLSCDSAGTLDDASLNHALNQAILRGTIASPEKDESGPSGQTDLSGSIVSIL